MTLSLRIHMNEAGPPEIEKEIERVFARLERYSDEIHTCQVWVEAPHGHHRQGRLYGVRVLVNVPDEEIVVRDQPRGDDLRILVRRSFDATRRQLQDYVRRRRRDVARHTAGRRRPGERRV